MTVRFNGGFKQGVVDVSYELDTGLEETKHDMRLAYENKWSMDTEFPNAERIYPGCSPEERAKVQDRVEYSNGFAFLSVREVGGAVHGIRINLNKLLWWEISES